MIIDVNTYIGHWPFRQLRNNTAEGLAKLMAASGIDMAAVSSINSVFYKDTQEGNQELYEELQPYNDKFIPFAVINPAYTAWKKDFLYCIEKLGMKGLEMYPYYHNYELDNPCAIELAGLAGEMGVPVHLPCCIVNIRQRHWLDTISNLEIDQVEKLLEKCPNTDFIITNGPSAQISGRLKQAASQRNGRLMFDFARVEAFQLSGDTSPFKRLVANAGIENVVFGSVMPFQYTAPQFVRLEYSGLGKEDIEKVTHGNLKQLFKLK